MKADSKELRDAAQLDAAHARATAQKRLAVPNRDERVKVVRRYGTNTDIEDLKRAKSLLAAEKRVLEMITGGARLTDTQHI